MIEPKVSLTSLCYITEGYDENTMLVRLADIEDRQLHTPFKSNRNDTYFENRERLYRNDGPTIIGAVGIWHWTAVPNLKNPSTDYIQTFFVEHDRPVRIITTPSSSLDDVVDKLKKGTIKSRTYICDTLFCYQSERGQLTGVLCKADEFRYTNACIKLYDDICVLPYYSITVSDVFISENQDLHFYRSLDIGEPIGYFHVENAYTVVQSILLERITWPFFKECTGATKAAWRTTKTLLECISRESLYDSVSKKIKCTPEEAEQVVDDFINYAYMNIEAGDIDTDIIAQIAMRNDDLRNLCEESLSQKWYESHASKIAQADAEFAAKESAAADKIFEMNRHLEELEKEVTAIKGNRDNLLTEIENTEEKLKGLLAKISQYEILGNETVAAVRQKILDAQKNVASFIADLSFFMPLASATQLTKSNTNHWKYECAKDDIYTEEDTELVYTWKEAYNGISQNLSSSLSVESTFGSMLAAFLYSAYINRVPLLIAGPGGTDIANVLSVSLYAEDAGRLTLGDEFDYDIVNNMLKFSESVISIRNMFGKGWSDTLPQEFAQISKQIIWTHPTAEDLTIEPKGLFNYMLPVLSESFIGKLPAKQLWPGKCTKNNFRGFSSPGPKPLKLSTFKRLGISKLLLNTLKLVLSDAKELLDNPSADKDIEVLLGLLPLCVVTGRRDILNDVIDSENGISSAVKAEVARYIEEE